MPIRWDAIGFDVTENPIYPTLSTSNPCPHSNIGKYKFNNVAPDDYVIVIARNGFLTRYGVVSVTGDHYLGHREILGGDVNGDQTVNTKDLSSIAAKIAEYGFTLYNPIYDLTGDKGVFPVDIDIIQINLGASGNIYKETNEWIK